MSPIKSFILNYLRPFGKQSFLSSLQQNAKILDLGCGNTSVIGIKAVLPNCSYVGIDVLDYNQTDLSRSLMDRYLISKPDEFATIIKSQENDFDAVISCHNLEHCNDMEETLLAMIKVTKINGKIYLSFPSKQTVSYPSRKGTLNYFDDDTHQAKPPNFEKVVSMLEHNGCEITFAVEKYRPLILRMFGFIMEPFSAILKKNLIGTWELYGFETVIHAKKLKEASK